MLFKVKCSNKISLDRSTLFAPTRMPGKDGSAAFDSLSIPGPGNCTELISNNINRYMSWKNEKKKKNKEVQRYYDIALW